MKKILTVSIMAVMAVTAANAEIASRAYVDTQDNAVKDIIGALSGLSSMINDKSTVVGAINEVAWMAEDALKDVTAEGSNGVDASATNGNIVVEGVNATTSAPGVVQLADAAAITTGTTGRVVDAAQLKVVSDAVGAVSTTASGLNGRLTTAEGKITTAEGNITTLMGADTVAGSVAKAEKDAKTYADGAAAAAETAAKAYADGLASNYDAAGSAASAETAAKAYADSLASGYDAAGSAASAVAALDATVSQTAGTDGLALTVTEVDGKLTSVTGSIAANTYDAYGAASGAVAALNGGTTTGTGVVTGITQSAGNVSVTKADPLSVTNYAKVAGNAADGKYALTATVTDGSITGYKWELISRTGNESAD